MEKLELNEGWLLQVRRISGDVLSPEFGDKDPEEQRYVLFGLKRKMQEFLLLLEEGDEEGNLFADNIRERIERETGKKRA